MREQWLSSLEAPVHSCGIIAGTNVRLRVRTVLRLYTPMWENSAPLIVIWFTVELKGHNNDNSYSASKRFELFILAVLEIHFFMEKSSTVPLGLPAFSYSGHNYVHICLSSKTISESFWHAIYKGLWGLIHKWMYVETCHSVLNMPIYVSE